MRHLFDAAHTEKQARDLLILLPPATSPPEDFITQGFVRNVRERDLDIDLVLVELAFETIADQTALQELHQCIQHRLQAHHYQHVWLAGISIGAYEAIAYMNRYPDVVQGVLLIAPYPGNRMTTTEIALAGGVQDWVAGELSPEYTDRGNWQWLKSHAHTAEVYLAYGDSDRFASGIAMMEQVLPAHRIDKVAGGHDWPTWRQLWCNLLDKRFGGSV